jgi:hypothetical protein
MVSIEGPDNSDRNINLSNDPGQKNKPKTDIQNKTDGIASNLQAFSKQTTEPFKKNHTAKKSPKKANQSKTSSVSNPMLNQGNLGSPNSVMDKEVTSPFHQHNPNPVTKRPPLAPLPKKPASPLLKSPTPLLKPPPENLNARKKQAPAHDNSADLIDLSSPLVVTTNDSVDLMEFSSPPVVSPKAPSVVTLANIAVRPSPSNPSTSFSTYKTQPDFAFAITMGSNKFELKGIGADSNGRIKASGAFGRVFFGTDQNGRKVAVKVAVPPGGSGMEALKKEGDFLCKMNGSKNVIGASEVGYMDGSSPMMFVVMDHIDGEELQDKLINQSNPMKLKPRIAALQDVALGLQELHQQGIVHRDLKPENTFVENSTTRSILVDLGLSETSEIGKQATHTSGTPPYISPESWSCKPQGTKSDTYSFGIMTHEMLTGGVILANPNNKDGSWNKANIQMRMTQDITASPNDYSPLIPLQARQQIATLVNSCLKCNPDQRISDDNLINQLNEIKKTIK